MTVKSLFGAVAASVLLISASQASAAPAMFGGGSTLANNQFTKFLANETANKTLPGVEYCSIGSGAGETQFLNQAGLPDTPINLAKCSVSDATSAIATVYDDYVVSDGGINVVPNSSVITQNNLAQLPISIAPIMIVQGDQAAHNHTLGRGNASLDICQIFSGRVSDQTVYYRSDTSGSSYALAKHLLFACPTGTFQKGAYASENFTTLFPGGVVPANFKQAKGSDGMYTAVYGTNAKVWGYIGPDYTSIVDSSHRATLAVKVALTANKEMDAAGNEYDATPANIQSALRTSVRLTSTSAQVGINATNLPGLLYDSAKNVAGGYPILAFNFIAVKLDRKTGKINPTSAINLPKMLNDLTTQSQTSGYYNNLPFYGFVPAWNNIFSGPNSPNNAVFSNTINALKNY